MRNYYRFAAAITVLVTAVCIYGFILVGSPVSQQALNYDSRRTSDFSSIKYSVQDYFTQHGMLPDSLKSVPNASYYLLDPETKKPYEYKVDTKTAYSLCTIFSTKADAAAIRDYYGSTEFVHKKGYDCIRFSVTGSAYTPAVPTRPVTQEATLYTQLTNPGFEIWYAGEPAGWKVRSGGVTKVADAREGTSAVSFAEKKAQQILSSEKIKRGTNNTYEMSIWYKTESDCTDCAFTAYTLYDRQGNEISTGADTCGKYNPFTKSWVNYISGKSSTYKKFVAGCTLPPDTYSMEMKVGIWNESAASWQFDDVKFGPKNTADSYLTSDTKPCPTALKDGMCTLPNCSYSYPNDIYTKGKVVLGEAFKKYGTAAGTFYDECTEDKHQVKEAVCSGTNEGNYNVSWAIYPCQKGCVDGACIE